MSKLKRFSHAEIKRMAERDELADGNYRFLLTGFKRVEEEGKPYILALTLNPLEDPENIDSKHRISVTARLTMGESESSGEIENFRMLETGAWGAAMFDGVDEMAVWNKASKKWVTSDDEMDSEAGNEHNAKVREEGLDKLMDAYEDDSNETLQSLVGQCCVYGTITRSVAKSGEYAGRSFVNIRNPRKVLGASEELVPADNFIYRKKAVDEDEPAPAKKSIGAKKPVSKKR